MMRKTLLSVLAGAALIAALIASSASAAQGPPAGRGETTLGNNLSVPAIFVPSVPTVPALRVACATAGLDGKAPGWDGVPPSTEFPGYWLQKTEATWSASCTTAAAASVIADWGDNLTTSPSLAAGKPIRVEVGLLDPAATDMNGYTIINLTPELADRLATYGTRGENGDAFVTGDAGAPYTRVWDAVTNLTIEQLANGTWTTIFSGPMTAEINSTGAVVYGYNWGSKGRKNTPTAGTYRLTFTTSELTTITGVADLSGNIPTFTDHSTSVTITLTAANRGGGKGPR